MRPSTIFVTFALALCASAAPLGGEEDGQIDARNVVAPRRTTKGGGGTTTRGGTTTTARGTTTTSRTSPTISSRTTSSRSTSSSSRSSSSRSSSPSSSGSASSSRASSATSSGSSSASASGSSASAVSASSSGSASGSASSVSSSASSASGSASSASGSASSALAPASSASGSASSASGSASSASISSSASSSAISSSASSSSAMSSSSAAPSAESSGPSCPLVTNTAAIPAPTKGAKLPGNAPVGKRFSTQLEKRAKYTLYHGTCKHNKDGIAQSGLRLGDPGDFTYKNAVYLSPDKSSAAGFIVDKPSNGCTDENDYAVLQFELDTDKADGIVFNSPTDAQQFQDSIFKYSPGVTEDMCPRSPADEDAKAKHDKADYISGTLTLEGFQESKYVHNPFPQVAIITQKGLQALTYKGCEQIDPKYISNPDGQGNKVTEFQQC